MQKKRTFEQSMTRLEQLVDLMENPECGIEKLAKYYKEAVELSAFLNESLLGFEKTVTLLTETNGRFEEIPANID